MPTRKHKADLKIEFQSAYDTHADALFRYALFKLSDREKAKDVVQDTFVRFWEYIAADGQVDNKKAFLYRIASNAIIDNYRKRKEISLDVLREEGVYPVSTIDTETERKIVEHLDTKRALELVNELDGKGQEVILLRYVEGLSVKEIAEVLEERENTISVKLHRAMKELQTLFEKHEQ
jgi:RNA polymerase sigma-70 factor (ECF subfamily)